jgi:6-phosphogluconolactonase (cycloisomerase 2 family)
VANELDSTVATYRFDADAGELTPLQILPALPSDYVGDNTSAGIFTSQDGRYLYTSNRGHDSISIYEIDQTTGLLSHKGWQPTLGAGPRFFTFDSSGDWLFAANEKGNNLVRFRVDRKTGLLSAQGDEIQTGSPVCMVFTHLT